MLKALRIATMLWSVSAGAHAQGEEVAKLLRGATSTTSQPKEVEESEKRALSASPGQDSSPTPPSPGCNVPADYTRNKDCAGAILGSLGDLFGLLGKSFTGSLEEGDWQTLAGSAISATQGMLEAHVLFFPVTLISQIFFPILKSMVGVAMEPASVDTLSAFVSLKQLFRQKVRSNQIKMDAMEEEFDWFDGLFLKNKTLLSSSPVYEAAGLSYLLNFQHDFALNQDLFFGAECLLVGDESNFLQIPGGLCSEQAEASSLITEKQLCEQAAIALGLDNTTVGDVARADRPYGCYNKKEGVNKGLWFNTDHGAHGQNATAERMSLCSTSEVLGEVGATCMKWQEAGTWEVAAMYALTNLGVLSDIARHFPGLRETTRKRALKLTSKYEKLLGQSFSVYRKHRESLLKKPEVSDGWANAAYCKKEKGLSWSGRYVTEGRDYHYQRPISGEPAEKCRGECDVMYSFCQLRPERGAGKYCVADDKWSEADSCFDRYKSEEMGALQTAFDRVTGNITALHTMVAHR